MNGELWAAAERLDKRSAAALGAEEARAGGVADNLGPFLLSGFDLDLEEVRRYCARIHQIAVETVAEGDDPAEIALALNVEGMVIGLLIAEARDR